MMEQIEIEIQDVGYGGEGVGRADGKVCFVPYTLTGEVVKAEIVQKNASFSKARLVKVLKPSNLREEAPCPYFSKCGGCDFQHTNYVSEIEIKIQILKKQLEKVGFFGKIDVKTSKNPYFYRNKITLFCKDDNLALFQAESKNLVPIEKCLLVQNEINEAIKNIQNFIIAKKLGKNIKKIVIRRQNLQILVLFDFLHACKVDFAGLQIMLGAKAGIFSSVNGGALLHQSGIERMKETEPLDCSYGVQDFHQVNDEIAQKMYQKVIKLASGDVVINAYSGAGLLSGLLAKQKKCVYGVEIGVNEHNSAQKLKENNNLQNLFNIQGDCAQHIPKLLERGANCLIVDPPRAGIDQKVCNAIEISLPNQVIYISCNPATLVRDIGRLKSYSLQSVSMFDMFPRTANMEVVCNLVKKAN